MDTYQKSGYLNSDYKIFYLTDSHSKEFPFHYHDFHKLLIFLEGDISYSVEGREYNLHPGNIVLINAGEIHRPVIRNQIPYKRIIAYISPDFFSPFEKEGFHLSHCFEQAKTLHSNLIQLSAAAVDSLQPVIVDLVRSFGKNIFCHELYQRNKLIEFLILLNNCIMDETHVYLQSRTAHPVIRKILDYINEHITEDLSIDRIAEAMYLNRSYLMHLFKSETGYTIGKYISEKRLFLANHLIGEGVSITDACYRSGFRNYSAFFQAYRNKYHVSPREGGKSSLVNAQKMSE